MTTSANFDTADDDEEPGIEDWERTTMGDIIEEDGERMYAIMDREFDDAIIKSDTSVNLRKME